MGVKESDSNIAADGGQNENVSRFHTIFNYFKWYSIA